MKIIVLLGLFFFVSICSADTIIGSSSSTSIDLRGFGPWQRHIAAASEMLTYSSAWATNGAIGAKVFCITK